MPIIPVSGWQETYARFMATLLESVPLSRITLGSICSYPQALRLMELKLGKRNTISTLLDRGPAKSDDGRLRFGRSTREEVYRCLVECIVPFRWPCVKRFQRRGIVGCQHLNLWRTAHGYQTGTRALFPPGGGTAAI